MKTFQTPTAFVPDLLSEGPIGKQAVQSPDSKLATVFQQFVGESFYQLMLKSLREMHDKPAYLHGGQAESLFQSRLDQEVASKLAQDDIGSFSNGLLSQFNSQLAHSAKRSSGQVNALDMTV